MLRYAITDGRVLEYGGSALLAEQAARWAAAGMDYIQLREKDLSPAGLAKLARGVLRAMEGSSTRLLINHRADVAVAVGAHGVHLTSAAGELSPAAIRALYDSAGLPAPVVSASAHNVAELTRAITGRADLILFGPVFGKVVAGQEIGRRLGLGALLEACSIARGSQSKVLALGGVSKDNLKAALEVGAAGAAGIRFFANEGPRTDFIAPQKL